MSEPLAEGAVCAGERTRFIGIANAMVGCPATAHCVGIRHAIIATRSSVEIPAYVAGSVAVTPYNADWITASARTNLPDQEDSLHKGGPRA